MSSALPPAVLLDVDVAGLAIARSLGRRGVAVWGLDADPGRWSVRSRYCRPVKVARLRDDDGPALRVLEEIGRSFRRAVLFATNDDSLTFVVRNRAHIERWFRIPHPGNAIIEAMVDKRGMAAVCRRAGIPIPRTWEPGDAAELNALMPDIPFPCLVKPAFSLAWRAPAAERIVAGAKAVRADSPAQLLAAWQRLAQAGSPLLVQEEIPGPDASLFYCAGYYAPGAAANAQFCGCKLRTWPVHLGRGTLVESVRSAELAGMSLRLARHLNYRGNLGVEFKYDHRDRTFKLIEANARFGLWDGFAADCGVDLAYCAYRDAVGLPLALDGRYRCGIRWLHLEKDLGALAEMRRRSELSLGAWLHSILKVRSHAVLAWDDPLPFVYYALKLARHYALRAASRRPRPK